MAGQPQRAHRRDGQLETDLSLQVQPCLTARRFRETCGQRVLVADRGHDVGPAQRAGVDRDRSPGDADGAQVGQPLAVDRDRLGAGLPEAVDQPLEVGVEHPLAVGGRRSGASSATTRTPGPRTGSVPEHGAEQADRGDAAPGRCGRRASWPDCSAAVVTPQVDQRGAVGGRAGCLARGDLAARSRRSRSSLTALREVCAAAVTTRTAKTAITSAPVRPMRRRRRGSRRASACGGPLGGDEGVVLVHRVGGQVVEQPHRGLRGQLRGRLATSSQRSVRVGARRSRSAISLRTCQA